MWSLYQLEELFLIFLSLFWILAFPPIFVISSETSPQQQINIATFLDVQI